MVSMLPPSGSTICVRGYAEALAPGQQLGSAKAIVDTLKGWAFLAFQAEQPLAAV
jgi:hypothetical protein